MHNFKKKFGQNFLKSSRFAEKILEPLTVESTDTIIEIGPGDGILTNQILKLGASVICIEKDYDLLSGLIKRFSSTKRFFLEHSDVLEANINDLLVKFNLGPVIKVTGSLPYNISKKIISIFLKLKFENGTRVDRMSFLVQEEVAKEYVKVAPEATFLSNFVRVFAEVRKFETVPSREFFPEPKVNGAILFFKIKDSVPAYYKELINLIKIGFSAPRKTLFNNLKNSKKWEAVKIEKCFEDNKLSLKLRPAEIKSEEWEIIFNILKRSD